MPYTPVETLAEFAEALASRAARMAVATRYVAKEVDLDAALARTSDAGAAAYAALRARIYTPGTVCSEDLSRLAAALEDRAAYAARAAREMVNYLNDLAISEHLKGA